MFKNKKHLQTTPEILSSAKQINVIRLKPAASGLFYKS